MRAEPQPENLAEAIRPMMPADASAVANILLQAPEAANWSEWSLLEAAVAPRIALVSERSGVVTGFLLARQIEDEAEILNLGVLPTRRRRGTGSALLEEALTSLRSRGVARVFLEVRESNSHAIAFYAKHGFAETGRRKSYYREPDEAAVLMQRLLTHSG